MVFIEITITYLSNLSHLLFHKFPVFPGEGLAVARGRPPAMQTSCAWADEQCGGAQWTGPSCCEAGYYCDGSNCVKADEIGWDRWGNHWKSYGEMEGVDTVGDVGFKNSNEIQKSGGSFHQRLVPTKNKGRPMATPWGHRETRGAQVRLQRRRWDRASCFCG